MRARRLLTLSAATLLAALASPLALSAQALETETARPLRAGAVVLGQNFEYQTSGDGSETALPTSVELGITNRLEFLVEPVAYTAIRSKTGAKATGAGDLEATVTWLAGHEAAGRPALAFAGEVKFPTARNSLIGTRKTDFAGYLIASKQFGRVDTHANLSYTVVGRPTGVSVNNIVGGAVAAEYRFSSRSELFAEVLGNTSAGSGEPSATGSPAAAEVTGSEVVGTIGAGTNLFSGMFVSFSVSYDNNGAVLFRPGFTLRLH